MANYFIMPKAQTVDWSGTNVFPDVDQFAYRAAHEGHGSEKALRVDMFENHQTDNPNVVHTYASETCLRFQKLVTEGTLQVGDYFILGMIDPLAELDFLAVEQLNTVPGLQLKIMALDSTLAAVEDEGIVIDFTNAKVGNRWATQPVQKYNYNEAGTNVLAARGEVFWLAARVEALPVDWFDECECGCCIPHFKAHLRYEDLCLPFGMEACAPQDVKDAYDAAMALFTGTIVLWRDIEVDKSLGGWAGCS
jgi:hypothetical protein